MHKGGACMRWNVDNLRPSTRPAGLDLVRPVMVWFPSLPWKRTQTQFPRCINGYPRVCLLLIGDFWPKQVYSSVFESPPPVERGTQKRDGGITRGFSLITRTRDLGFWKRWFCQVGDKRSVDGSIVQISGSQWSEQNTSFEYSRSYQNIILKNTTKESISNSMVFHQ